MNKEKRDDDLPAEGTHEYRVAWLQIFAAEMLAQLNLEGEIGIGRECVLIHRDGCALWYDYENCDPPESVVNAYHKDTYLAVLGRAEDQVEELYDWCLHLKSKGYNRTKIHTPEVLTLTQIMGRQEYEICKGSEG